MARIALARVLHALVGRHSLVEYRLFDGYLVQVECRFCDLGRA